MKHHLENSNLDLTKIDLLDLEDVLCFVLDNQVEAGQLYKKILLYNSRQQETHMQIQNLRDLLGVDAREFMNTKGVGNAGVLIVKFLKQAESLDEAGMREVFDQVLIDLSSLDQIYLEIPLSDIDILLIPSLIRKKLTPPEFQTIGDVLTRKNHFKSQKGNHRSYLQFIDILLNQQDQIRLDYQFRTHGKSLIEVPPEENSGELLDWFQKIAAGYLEEISKREGVFIERYWGLIGKKSYTLFQLANLYGLTRERVRQILHEHMVILQQIIVGQALKKKDEKKFVYRPVIPKELSTQYASLFGELGQHAVITEANVLNILEEDFNTKITKTNGRYLDFFLRIAGLEKVISSIKSTTYGTGRFSSSKYYLKNPSSKDIERFLTVGNAVYDILQEAVLPMSEFDLLVEVCEKTDLTMKDQEYLLSIIEQVLEFEELDFEEEEENQEEPTYQLRFDLLSSWSARVERVLYEIGSEQHLDQLVELISDKYEELGKEKMVKRSSIRNGTRISPNIAAHGKRTIYSLATWGNDTGSIKELIYSTLHQAKKPLLAREIVDLVQKVDPYANEKSIRTILGLENWKGIWPLEGGSYILTDWKYKYKKRILPKVQKSEAGEAGLTKAQEAYEILKNISERPILQSEFRKLLIGTYKFRPGTSNTITLQETYFQRIPDANNRILLDIQPDVKVENERVKQKDLLTSKAIGYIEKQSGTAVKINELATWLHATYIPTKAKTGVYRILSQAEIFEKSVGKDGITYIGLVPSIDQDFEDVHQTILPYRNYQYNWEAIQRQLIIELKKSLMAASQPIASSGISMKDLLDLYYRFLKYQTGKIVLDQIADDLLLSIEKYFLASRDMHDAKAHHKVILLSLEACMLKMIYLIDQDRFQQFELIFTKAKKGTTGLGAYFSTLTRIDPDKFRFKDPQLVEIPVRDFLPYINLAYQTRNKIAHLGGDYNSNSEWDSTSINQNIKSALITALYSVFLYRDEIESQIR